MPSALITMAFFLAGCTQDTPMEKGLCHTVGEDTANPDYLLADYNFSCDTVPIEQAFNLNSDSFVSYASLDQGDVIVDFEDALLAWSTTGAGLWLNAGDEDSSATGYDQYDNTMNLMMREGGVTDEFTEGDSIATAILTGVGSEYEPIAIDCDVLFWQDDATGTPYNYIANGVPASDEVDIAYIFAHELGHCVGLLDQWDDAQFVDAIMFETYTLGTDFTGLSADEIEGALFLYGEGT